MKNLTNSTPLLLYGGLSNSLRITVVHLLVASEWSWIYQNDLLRLTVLKLNNLIEWTSHGLQNLKTLVHRKPATYLVSLRQSPRLKKKQLSWIMSHARKKWPHREAYKSWWATNTRTFAKSRKLDRTRVRSSKTELLAHWHQPISLCPSKCLCHLMDCR